jgi:hypothetical protein
MKWIDRKVEKIKSDENLRNKIIFAGAIIILTVVCLIFIEYL